MSERLYLAILVGIIVVTFAVCVPALLLKKCPRCGSRNGLDAKICRRCQEPFAGDPDA